MEDIVSATGLNRSSIYNTFGSKLALFIACFEKCESNYRNAIQEIILSSASPSKSLTQIFELSIKKTINGYLLPNYISELKNEEVAIKKLILSQHEYLIDLFTNIVKRGQSLGLVNNSKAPKQYAMYLVASYQGLKIMSELHKDENALKNTIQYTLAVLD